MAPDNPSAPALYTPGAIFAAVGLAVIAAYYFRAWRHLRATSELVPSSDNLLATQSHPWPELRYLKGGIAASVLFFMLAVAAEAPADWLDRLTGSLLGFCAALSVAVFGVAIVSLANLWKELALQLRQARIISLLTSIPLAFLGLALGLGVFVSFGALVDKIPPSWTPLVQVLLWFLIAAVLLALWRGRNHVALMLRTMLMVGFSAIIAATLAFGIWWVIFQPALLLVVLLCAIGSLNVIFYSRWVRLKALGHSLE